MSVRKKIPTHDAIQSDESICGSQAICNYFHIQSGWMWYASIFDKNTIEIMFLNCILLFPHFLNESEIQTMLNKKFVLKNEWFMCGIWIFQEIRELRLGWKQATFNVSTFHQKYFPFEINWNFWIESKNFRYREEKLFNFNQFNENQSQ